MSCYAAVVVGLVILQAILLLLAWAELASERDRTEHANRELYWLRLHARQQQFVIQVLECHVCELEDQLADAEEEEDEADWWKKGRDEG